MAKRVLAIALPVGLLALVCLRSWVFVRFPNAHFDSDQAVFGLMSKDLIAGRALPMFLYGSRYLLAVSVWLAAPLMALFGSSAFLLKLPLLLMNGAVVLMLWRGLRKEGLDRLGTTVSILPVAFSGVVLSSRLVEHGGGNIEPFVFVIGAYFLSNRPIWLGILLGVAYLNREFSILALGALVLIDTLNGQLRVRLKQRLVTVVCLALVVWGLRILATHTPSYFGAGVDEQMAHPKWENVKGFFSEQLPSLLAAAPRTLRDFNITSALSAGHTLVYPVLAIWGVLVLAWLALLQPLKRNDISGFSTYLLLVGSGQAAAFMALTPYPFNVMQVRHILLALLGFVGLLALSWRRPVLRPFTLGLVLLMAGLNLFDHANLWREYAKGPPHKDLELLATQLLARGVRYVRADYWVAYDIAWQTQERILATPEHGQTVRIMRYEKLVSRHARQAFHITDGPCEHGEHILRWNLCPPPTK